MHDQLTNNENFAGAQHQSIASYIIVTLQSENTLFLYAITNYAH